MMSSDNAIAEFGEMWRRTANSQTVSVAVCVAIALHVTAAVAGAAVLGLGWQDLSYQAYAGSTLIYPGYNLFTLIASPLIVQ